MKKLLSVFVFSALTFSSAFGAVAEGMITKLVVLEGGDIEVVLGTTAGKRIRNANSNKQEMYAMLLTAQTAGKYIKVTHNDGYIKTVAQFTTVPAP